MTYYRTIVRNRSVNVRINHHGEFTAVWHDGLGKVHSTDSTDANNTLFNGVRELGYMLEKAADRHEHIIDRLQTRGNNDQAIVEQYVVNDLLDAALELYRTATRAIDQQYHTHAYEMMHQCAAYRTVPAFL